MSRYTSCRLKNFLKPVRSQRNSMTITICSSVDFTPKIIEVKKKLEAMDHAVNIPYFTEMVMNGEMSFEEYLENKEKGGDISLRQKQATDMIRRYWDFIRNS